MENKFVAAHCTSECSVYIGHIQSSGSSLGWGRQPALQNPCTCLSPSYVNAKMKADLQYSPGIC